MNFFKFFKIFFVFLISFFCYQGNGDLITKLCEAEVASAVEDITVLECNDDQNTSRNSTVSIRNIDARWSALTVDDDNKLQLSLSFLSYGSGSVKIILTSQTRQLFCGILNKSNQVKPAVINAWIKCDQNGMKIKDKLQLTMHKMATGRKRRSLYRTVSVDFPGCTIPEFKRTALCQEQREEKIRFHARRVPKKRSIRVVLSRSVYSSKFEDSARVQSRKYFIALLEEPPPEIWLGVGEGKILEMKTVRYPTREVRFRRLAPKQTYIIAVWRHGHVKRYAKKITMC